VGRTSTISAPLPPATNRLGIGLDEALRKKEAINETRTWV
jgi:hypothetical protein